MLDRKASIESGEFEPATDLNVVILPDTIIRQKLIALSSRIAREFPTFYVLDDEHLPHLSLYSARYPARNMLKIEKSVEELTKGQPPFKIDLSGFSFFSGYVFYDVVPNKTLQGIHERVVDSLNSLREGQISDVQRGLIGLTEEQKKAIETYGYVSVKRLYMPHISLTRLANPELACSVTKLLATMDEKPSFEVSKIAITPFGPYGTCPKILQTFRFK